LVLDVSLANSGGLTSLSDKKTLYVPLPKTDLEFTGERFTTLTQGEIRHEHLHRYFFALQFCAGKRVLDIASGEGYGSALLATVASEVIGVEVAEEAVRHAAENYSTHNLRFLHGDARRIPVDDASIEIVVSFETLEHLSEHEEFLREIKRVLCPGGLLVLSTPDRDFFASWPPNPFHLKELTEAGFRDLIGEHFKNSGFLFQSSLTGSSIVADREVAAGGSYEGFRRVRDNIYETAAGLPSAMYIVGIASDAPLPEVRAGSFDDRPFQLDLYAELQRRHIEMLHREADVETLRRQIGESSAREAQLGAELTGLREELLRRDTETEYLRKEQEAARARVTERETELRRIDDERNRLEGKLEALDQELGVFRVREEQWRRNSEEMFRIQSDGAKLLLRVQSDAATLNKEKVALRAEADRLIVENANLRERTAELEASVRRNTEALRGFQAEAESLKQEVGALRARDSEAQIEMKRLRDRQARMDAESAAAAANLIAQGDTYRQKAADLQEEVEAVKNSLSWTISAPLRWIGIPAAGIRAGVMKAIYGTPMFQYTGKPLARLISNVKIPGASWLLPKNPLFDASFYARRNPDAAKGSKNLWAHYLACGSDESRNPHPLFQTAYYKAQNPDVQAAGINPLIHYFDHGARENRDPSPDFDTSFYLELYPDVGKSGANPLIHFALHGRREGRVASLRSAPTRKAFEPPQVSARQNEKVPDTGAKAPLISVLMPTFNTPSRYLRLAIESVLRQSYKEWQLCIYDDGSSLAETIELLKQYRARDPRIQVEFGGENRGIATATNGAIALATGQYITMLDHDDEIVPEALLEVANVLNGDPGIDALYTDQAYIEADGTMGQPFYKPDWSPEMFRGVMFVGHLLVVRKSLAVELKGFDAAFDRVQDFEFMLRVAEKTAKIYHLRKILYYWRRIPGSVAFHGNEKGPIEPIQASAVNAHLKRMGIPAVAEPHPVHAHRLTIKPTPRASTPSVLIVVRDAPGMDSSAACISSIRERTAYSNFEVMPAQPREKVEVPGKPIGGPPDYLLWVDSDLELVTSDWIEHLLLYCEQAQIACTAPLIVNRNGTVWHSGLVLGMNGVVGYPMQGLPADSDGSAGSLSCAREVSCVSGECLMVSRQSLEAMGGQVRFYQDSLYDGADLSLRAYTAGLRNIVNPRVILRRLTESRTTAGGALDRALFADRWGAMAKYGDKFYNPNFVSTSPGYEDKQMVTAVAV
jgi:GT2 family glycosyltransferase/ubiquinone/menaquinone biosynthesis C-methylase UbiE